LIQAVTLDDVRSGEARFKGLIAVTPRPHSETLSVLTGSRVFVKIENLDAVKRHLHEAGYTVEEILHR